ncbi:MAG: SIMPL domain-containing protein [Methanosarcinales archaeon]|nr:SIMPL domain-containing protein [Methanosarcinales archaeon]
MKNRTTWIIAFLLAGLVVSAGLATAGFWGGSSDAPTIQQKKVITVSGYGTVDTTPDEAVLRLSVVTQAEDVKDASDENAKKMDACMAALHELGIAEDDAVTSGYRVRPRYNWRDDEESLIGFQVRNSLTVTARDIEKVGDVIGAALASGANEIDDVIFTVSDERQADLRDEAIADAARRASADASSVAKAMGVKIKGPIEISTTGSRFSPYRMYMSYDICDEGMMAIPEAEMTAAPMKMGAGPQIQPGDVTVSAQVIVVYEFG